ncbi:MAG: nucleotide sugar dehydrogenase [Actinobacteria bacterium]|nr:nucleotide sugar dehydrogenase [Actinomycetota bacterium]
MPPSRPWGHCVRPTDHRPDVRAPSPSGRARHVRSATSDQRGHPTADRKPTVCVVGQGYVGLSVAAAAATAGLRVHGVDRDVERVRALAAGRLAVPAVDEPTFALAVETGRLTFGTEAEVASEADVTLICVPTPVVDHRPDLSAVEAAAAAVAPHLRPGALVILESTTYPGTTEEIVTPLLERGGLRTGHDLLVAYSPERIDPGNRKYGLANTPRIVAGVTPEAAEAAADFYARITDEVHILSSCRAAELAKLLENTFRMVNIALVNELATVCAEQGIAVWEVIEAAATKPFGFMAFQPGPGVGGHCIPLDPQYLAWQSRHATGRRFRLLELAQDINIDMPVYVANRIGEALNAHSLAVRGADVLALGVTYKPDVGDLRESAAVQVLRRLLRNGAKVRFHDPFVDRLKLDGTVLERSAVNDAALLAADCVALLTPHGTYDIEQIVACSRLLFDARNATGRLRAGGTCLDRVVVL